LGGVEASQILKTKGSAGRNGSIRITNKNMRFAQSTDGSYREFSPGKTNTLAARASF